MTRSDNSGLELCYTCTCKNRIFKPYFWAIGKVSKRPWDVNQASQRSQHEGGQAAMSKLTVGAEAVDARVKSFEIDIGSTAYN